MIHYDVKLDKIGSNTAFRVEKNPFSWSDERYESEWQSTLKNSLQTTNETQISSKMMSQIFAPNSDLYINTQIANALASKIQVENKLILML